MHRRTTQTLLATLMATSSCIYLMSALPAFSAPDANSGAQHHVFPGAVPLHPTDESLHLEGPTPSGQADAAQTGTSAEPEQPGSADDGNSMDAAAENQSGDDAHTGAAQPSDAAQTTETQPSDEGATVVKAEDEQVKAQLTADQHYALASHYFSKWELDLAEIEFDETVSRYPDYKIAHRDLCLLSLVKLNLPRSLAEFMMVTGITDPTAYNAADKAALDQRALKAHYKKGLDWGGKANWNEAITELMWAQTYDPNSAYIHHSLAFAYASSGDFARAEEEYKQTFANAPKDGMAHADFANMLADSGQVGAAEQEMKKAVELTPNAAALHVDLGWLAETRNDFPTAEAEFKKAVELSPNHAGLWAHLGRLMEHQSETVNAQAAYNQALRLDGNCIEAKESLDRIKNQKPAV